MNGLQQQCEEELKKLHTVIDNLEVGLCVLNFILLKFIKKEMCIYVEGENIFSLFYGKSEFTRSLITGFVTSGNPTGQNTR
jgi:hypothetical protein